MKRLYLDNHTATRPSPAAVEKMRPYLERRWGNPTAPHSMGQELLADIEEAYRGIYRLLGASEEETILFTSSGAEAVNQVVLSSYLDLSRETGLNHYITSALDEAPVIMAYERLETLGCRSTLVGVTGEGQITAESLGDAFTPRTALVSLSWGNALTGTMQPVAELAAVCRERGILFHLDATHILGKIDFDLAEIGPDLVSFNGESLHAPRGTGALWMRSGLKISPLLVGGHDQGGLRAGALDVAGLVALGVACSEALEGRETLCMEGARLRDRLEEGLIARIEGASSPFYEVERLPTTASLIFPGVNCDALLYRLAQQGVFASFGGGTYQQLALQLEACGIPHPLADCAASFTLSRETTEAEIDEAIERIAKEVSELQRLSLEDAAWG